MPFSAGVGEIAMDLALIYSSKELTPYRVIEHAVQKIMEQIMARL